jgi:hypothetical protein
VEQKMPDYIVLHELPGTIDKVSPHQILGERKRTEHYIGSYLESRHVANCVANNVPNCGHVNAMSVRRQITIQAMDIQLKVVP